MDDTKMRHKNIPDVLPGSDTNLRQDVADALSETIPTRARPMGRVLI